MGKTKDLTVRSYTLVNMLKQLATDTANGVTPDPANYSGRGGGDWGGRGRGRGRGGRSSGGRGGRGVGDRGGRYASCLCWGAFGAIFCGAFSDSTGLSLRFWDMLRLFLCFERHRDSCKNCLFSVTMYLVRTHRTPDKRRGALEVQLVPRKRPEDALLYDGSLQLPLPVKSKPRARVMPRRVVVFSTVMLEA